MRYTWLLFDADNTLFDFDLSEKEALKDLCDFLSLEFSEAILQAYQRINKAVWQAFEEGAFPQAEIGTRRFAGFLADIGSAENPETVSKLYRQKLSEKHFLYDASLELVKTLSQTHKLLIITNGLKDVQRPRFNRSPIKSYFEAIVISDELGAAKPKPEIFDAAFEKMKQPDKSDVLIIGDSLSSDMQGGYRYGIDTCWFNPNVKANSLGIPITHEITRLEQLLALV